MIGFFRNVVDDIQHPRATMIALATGAASLVGLLGTLQQTCSQLSRVPHLPVHLVSNLQDASNALGVVVGVSLILAANGHSISHLFTSPPPPEGTPKIIPFPMAAQPQSQPLPLLQDEQKAA